jgi:hypothetical protein
MPYVPPIDNEFVLIVDGRQPNLAAVILSYIARPGRYTPVFTFNPVSIPRTEDAVLEDQKMAKIHGGEVEAFTLSALQKMKGCQNLILAGLSDNQRSYLTFLSEYNVIDIPSIQEVDFSLSSFQADNQYLLCRPEDIVSGLLQAIDTGSRLRVNEDAPPLGDRAPAKRDTLLVVERRNHASTAIALNYAVSVNADVIMVDALGRGEESRIKDYIWNWKKNDSADDYTRLSEAVTSRVWTVDFTQYDYATFFTTGLPYSVILKDPIPMTYVHLHWRPDHFIFNNIFFEGKGPFGGAVVFSPELFTNEEIAEVIDDLENVHYLVNKLLGRDATPYNIEMSVREFPYDILHFCSHGGEMEGFTVTGAFTDSDGRRHTYEYEEVFSTIPTPEQSWGDDDEIKVATKMFPRKLDGVPVNSPELDNLYADYILHEMWGAMGKGEEKRVSKKGYISGSCHIECAGRQYYQAMFNMVGARITSPFVFNNTCWSWSNVAECFLGSGAKGYIGTLWAVGTCEAAATARKFYRLAFQMAVCEALHAAKTETEGGKYANIYIYWGLPFTTLKSCRDIRESRDRVFRRLRASIIFFKDIARNSRSQEQKQEIQQLITWIESQLDRFSIEA